MTKDTFVTSDLMLERYRLGELPAPDAARISARAEVDEVFRARLAALADSDHDIEDRYGAGWLERAIAQRLAGTAGLRPARRPAPAWSALAAAAAVLVIFVGVATWPDAPSPVASDTVRIKGEAASLLVYRSTGSSSERLTDGDTARSGDLIRVAYRASSPRFGVIVSVDGRGVVTRHLPVSGDTAVALQAGEPTPLAAAYELDDAPRWEQFYLVTSDVAFDVEAVLEAARTAASGAGANPPATLRLPGELDQSSFLLRKGS